MSKSSGNKDKEKTLQEKLKNFFRITSKSPAVTSPRIKTEDFILTPDILKDIGPESNLNQRLKGIHDLSETVILKRLEENGIEALWQAVRDLIGPNVAKETRQTALHFVKCLIEGQYEKLGIMRASFFKVVERQDVSEDLPLRFEIIKALSENGRDIQYFECEMGPFLLNLMPRIMTSNKADEFLSLLVNVIKYNSAFLDEMIVTELVERTCTYIYQTTSKDGILIAIQVLEAIVCYSYLLPEYLECLIKTMCKTINVETYAETSWKLMRNLLGTHLGHSGVYIMCQILEHRQYSNDPMLLRGAVCFLGMSLWGTQRVKSLRHPPLAVLPSFLQCLQNKDISVAQEISLSLQRLVVKHGQSIHLLTWECLMKILEELLQITESSQSPKAMMIAGTTHEILTHMEKLHENCQFSGSIEHLFAIIEKCASKMPESSVLRMLVFKSQALNPLKAHWLKNLNILMERYYKRDGRTAVRVKALKILSEIIDDNRQIYEDDLTERIVLPLMSHIETEQDSIVLNEAVLLLINLIKESSSKQNFVVLEKLGKVANKPFEQINKEDTIHILNEHEMLPVQTAVLGLISIFKVKIFHLPSISAIEAFKLLVSHIQALYQSGIIHHSKAIRYESLKCFLNLRCNGLKQIGLPDADGTVKYSPYLLTLSRDKAAKGAVSPPATTSPTLAIQCITSFLQVEEAFEVIVTCLRMEKDWDVIKLILEELPHLLQNKSLILSSDKAVSHLCDILCAMISDRNLRLPETLLNTPAKFLRSDLHAHVLPVLASLVSYHKYMESKMQHQLVKRLEFGLVSKCSHICIGALTLCTLEMRETMYKLLPVVVISLSKISATVGIAIPILEFLSNLIRLPKLYASFVEEQYMSIFAIALPYTNPFKFNHYIVSLAHHVIAMWFLKCRLPFRKDFVRFIIKGLQSNVIVPLEEGTSMIQSQSSIQDDSGPRRRASSMNEQALAARRRDRAIVMSGGAGPVADSRSPIDRAMLDLQMELTETCIDLMARYTFATCSALPNRFPVSEFLLTGGQSMTWLLGNKLITITTSGGGSKIMKQGLCDKCLALVKGDKVKEDGTRKMSEFQPARRRHQSAVTVSHSSELKISQPRAKDDLQLTRPLSAEYSKPLDSTAVEETFTSTATSQAGGIKKKKVQMMQDITSQEPETQNLDKLLFGQKSDTSTQSQSTSTSYLCSCWCQGWAEILVRRPTGNVSWVMRIQNHPHLISTAADFPLADITTLFTPSFQSSDSESLDAYDLVSGHRRIDSECLGENEYEAIYKQHFELGTIRSDSSGEGEYLETESEEKIKSPSSQVTVAKQASAIENVTSSTTKTVKFKEHCTLRRVKSSPDILLLMENVSERHLTFRQESDPSSSVIESFQEKIVKVAKLGESGDSKASSIICQSPVTPEAKSASKEVISPDSVTTPVESKPPTNKHSLRRHSSHKEDKREAILEEPRLIRTCSEKGDKTKSPPMSPSSLQKDQSSFRDRGHTISVTNPTKHPTINLQEDWASRRSSSKDLYRSGINPSFIFLQLYHGSCFGSTTERPLLVPNTDVYDRALKVLDRITPYETHKIGLVYVGKSQVNNEAAILSNEFGSVRYVDFLQGLGRLIRLQDIDPQTTYVGGLDQKGEDGKFAYIWQDDVMQVIFHVATLMPKRESDPSGNYKKRHIGNDFVSIVYNDSGEEYNIQTIKGQFIYACVVIHPLEHGSNLVMVKTKPDLTDTIGPTTTKIISDQNLPILVRQLALHANLAAMIFQSQKQGSRDPYASNWLERLRNIKRLRLKVQAEHQAVDSDDSSPETPTVNRRKYTHVQDFTDFV